MEKPQIVPQQGKKLLDQVKDVIRTKRREASPCGTIACVPKTPAPIRFTVFNKRDRLAQGVGF